jgi:hypothetical protein
LVVVVRVQLSVVGSYLPPVFVGQLLNAHPPLPPQTIISLPVHTAVEKSGLPIALMVLMAVQVSVPGLYLPPNAPQTIISKPVHTAT